MSDIFISYASEDRAKAQKLAQLLENEGWSTFWDRTIPLGVTWDQFIGKELEEARCLVVLWSEASIASKWVREEARAGSNREILIPVRIEDVQPPFGFGGVQTADLCDWDETQAAPEFQWLVSNITRVIEGPEVVVDRPLTKPKGQPAATTGQLVVAILFALLTLPVSYFLMFSFHDAMKDDYTNPGPGDAGGRLGALIGFLLASAFFYFIYRHRKSKLTTTEIVLYSFGCVLTFGLFIWQVLTYREALQPLQ